MKVMQFRVWGTVQGVGFRAWTVRAAIEANLTGWVRNVRDGTVEGRVGGPDEIVDAFLRSLSDGPPGSTVDKVAAKPVFPRSMPSPFQVQPTADVPLDG